MAIVEEFQTENRNIIDLRQVLGVLVEKPDLHDNPVVCELLARFSEKLKMHLQHEDRSVYSGLLKHPDHAVNAVARRFIDNTHELNRILSKYTKRWCRPGADLSDHAAFTGESKEVFHLVDERLELESKRLFPLLGKG